MQEQKIIAALIRDRKSWDMCQNIVEVATLSPVSALLFKLIGEYYGTDPKADRCDVDILAARVEREIQSNKLAGAVVEALKQLPTDVSGINVAQELVRLRLDNIGKRLASLLAAGKTGPAVEELLKAYSDVQNREVKEESGTSEVIERLPVKDLISASFNKEGLIQLWPPSLNQYIDGGCKPGHHVLVFAPTEMGKCWKKGTEVLLYGGGKKKVEDIVIGDRLIGPDSTSRTVLSLGRGKEEMYRIQYNYGESYTVNKSHILSLKTHDNRFTEISVADYLNQTAYFKHTWKGWKAPVVYARNEVLLDPYIFGLWLGDGHSHVAALTTMDECIAAKWLEYGTQLGLRTRQTTYKNNKASTYFLSGPRSLNQNPFLKRLVELKVRDNKHIPDCYKYNDSTTLRALLAGIIDTDGYWQKHNWEIVQVRERLARDIVDIARFLGAHATINPRIISGKLYWRVNIYPTTDLHLPILLPHKKQQINKNRHKRNDLNFGFEIIPEGEGEYYGFTLDGDSLFLLADCSVNHNTLFVINAVAGFLRQGLIVLYVGNEDPAPDILMRIINRLTGMNKYQVQENPDAAQKLLDKRNYDKLIMAPLAPGNFKQITGLVEKYSPRVVILDQLRNLDVDSENRTQALEKAATEARNLAKSKAVLVVSVTQAADSASGKTILNRGDVDGSNVGIPGQIDLMIGMGATSEMEAANERMLSFPKNKLSGRHNPIAIRIDPLLSKVIDFGAETANDEQFEIRRRA